MYSNFISICIFENPIIYFVKSLYSEIYSSHYEINSIYLNIYRNNNIYVQYIFKHINMKIVF